MEPSARSRSIRRSTSGTGVARSSSNSRISRSMEATMPNPHENPGEVIARQVRAKGIDDPRPLEALRLIPRPRFLPPEDRAHALDGNAVVIGCGQTISQPYMVAA